MFCKRKIPLHHIISHYAEKLYTSDLNEEASDFALAYYDRYISDDYVTFLDNNDETLFHMPATWERYEQVKKIIDQRYQEWKKGDFLKKKKRGSLMSLLNKLFDKKI
ncbi:MAG: hypothetical protein ACK5LE_10240 [Alphaproteobacteria bacterium]